MNSFTFTKGANLSNKYAGPLTVIRKTKGGLYSCETPDGQTTSVAKRDLRLNICDCICHQPEYSVIHFISCCDNPYVKTTDLEQLLEWSIKENNPKKRKK